MKTAYIPLTPGDTITADCVTFDIDTHKPKPPPPHLISAVLDGELHWPTFQPITIPDDLMPGAMEEKPDPYADLKQAHSEGKVIEYASHLFNEWIEVTEPAWHPEFQYRIKPEPAAPWSIEAHVLQHFGRQLVEGEQWHRADFTQEMLEGGWRPLLYGENCSAGDEYRRASGKFWAAQETHPGKYDSNDHWSQHRTKRPLPPVAPAAPAVEIPEALFFEKCDIPPGSVLHFNSWGKPDGKAWVGILQVCHNGGVLIATTEPEWITWERLTEEFHISRDFGKTWHPCRKALPHLPETVKGDALREEFERFAQSSEVGMTPGSYDYKREGDSYWDGTVALCWKAFKAGKGAKS